MFGGVTVPQYFFCQGIHSRAFLCGISHERLQPKEQLPSVYSNFKIVQKSLVSSRSFTKNAHMHNKGKSSMQ